MEDAHLKDTSDTKLTKVPQHLGDEHPSTPGDTVDKAKAVDKVAYHETQVVSY
jgi:hypothetical protein